MADSSPSKLNDQEKNPRKNKPTSSTESETTEASPSLLTRLKKSGDGLKQKAINAILKRRNKPAKFLKRGDPNFDHKVSEPYDIGNTPYKKNLAFLRKLTVTLISQGHGARLGIAAPQIGEFKRVIIVLGKPMFNPEWTPCKGPRYPVYEGCYSLPKDDIYEVDRAKYGWARWYDEKAVYHEEKMTGLRSIVFQHEFDHLNGVCCDQIGKLRPKPEPPKEEAKPEA